MLKEETNDQLKEGKNPLLGAFVVNKCHGGV